MFHAENARRRAMEIEQAATAVENVDWPNCRRLYAALTDEMTKIKPALQRYVETRLIP
jgi:two-component system sensor histidine kinase/response regulator